MRSYCNSPALRSALSQVVVGVKVGQAHPFFGGHLAKVRVRLPFEVARLRCTAGDEGVQLAHIGLKFGRWGVPPIC